MTKIFELLAVELAKLVKKYDIQSAIFVMGFVQIIVGMAICMFTNFTVYGVVAVVLGLFNIFAWSITDSLIDDAAAKLTN